MVATTAGTVGEITKGILNKKIKKSEIKRSKGWGWRMGRLEEEKLRKT